MNQDFIVSGIVCKACKYELPKMLISEHLDKTNPKNKCLCKDDDEEDKPMTQIYTDKLFKILDILNYKIFHKHYINTKDKNEIRIYKKQKKMIIKDTNICDTYSQKTFSIASLTSWRYCLNTNLLELHDEHFIYICILLDDNELQIIKSIL